MSLLGSPTEPEVRQLLNTFDDVQLQLLAKTATGNRITPVTKNESIEAILLHTVDLAALFSYRRITSQVLYEYLHQQKVPVKGCATRYHLIKLTEELWTKSSRDTSDRERSRQERTKRSSSVKSNHGKSKSSNTTTSATTKVENHIHATIHVHNIQIIPSVGNSSLDSRWMQSDTLPAECNEIVSKSHSRVNVVRSDEFAHDFCEWFYTMLNRLQPQCANKPGDVFKKGVFFSNSSVDVYLVGQVSSEKHAQGQEDSFSLLRNVFIESSLMCGPNLTDGIQAQKSDHGMVRIFCCGTLHQVHAFVGIFEQEFGVVRDPVDRIWKILYTKVNLKHALESQMPKLPSVQIFEIEC